MPTLARRLRELDRRVLREEVITTPEGWRRAMGRWWLPVAGAGALYVIGFALSLKSPGYSAYFNVPILMLLTFQAGVMRGEHQRLTGSRRVLGRLRPPGV